MKPPTTAPTMPSRVVTTIPPPCLPGMRNLASAPAISPNTIHNTMPMVVSRYEVSRSVPPVHETGPATLPLPIVWAERVALGADLSIARLLSRGGPFSSGRFSAPARCLLRLVIEFGLGGIAPDRVNHLLA